MRVSINYTTFSRDYDWLKYSLQSLVKYATGFSEVIIVVPTWDLEKFLQFEKMGSAACPILVKTFLEYPGKGFVNHLAMKCYADVFSPDSDFILHMDPDCLFSEPCVPEDYFENGKPVLLYETYHDIRRAIDDGKYNKQDAMKYGWKSVTEAALGFECEVETMHRHPAVHHKFLYKETRERVEAFHRVPFTDFAIKQKNSFPQGFGEFNTLGSVAWKFHQDKYSFRRCSLYTPYPDVIQRITQLRSHDGAAFFMAKIREILDKC